MDEIKKTSKINIPVVKNEPQTPSPRVILVSALLVIVLCSVILACLKKSEKAVYSWYLPEENELESTFEYLKSQDIDKIFQFFTQNDDIYTIRYLEAAAKYDVKVYYLTGEPEWGTDASDDAMLQMIDRVCELNDENGTLGFAGIVMDCEPYTLEIFKDDPQKYLNIYIENMISAKRAASAKGLEFIACIPYYLDDLGYTKELERLITEGCTGISIMNYNKMDEIGQIQNEIRLATKNGKTASTAYEFQDAASAGLSEISTYHNNSIKDLNDSMRRMRFRFGQDISFDFHEYRSWREFTSGVK